MFSNQKLLKDIRETNFTMRVRGTGGVETTNKIGILPGYGEVWYKEGGIANIFSLSRVQKLYQVTYDSLKGNCFTIHMKEKSMHFCQSEDGLYYYDTRHEEFSLIYAVEENKRKFTYQQLHRAEEAWRVDGRHLQAGQIRRLERRDRHQRRVQSARCPAEGQVEQGWRHPRQDRLLAFPRKH